MINPLFSLDKIRSNCLISNKKSHTISLIVSCSGNLTAVQCVYLHCSCNVFISQIICSINAFIPQCIPWNNFHARQCQTPYSQKNLIIEYMLDTLDNKTRNHPVQYNIVPKKNSKWHCMKSGWTSVIITKFRIWLYHVKWKTGRWPWSTHIF